MSAGFYKFVTPSSPPPIGKFTLVYIVDLTVLPSFPLIADEWRSMWTLPIKLIVNIFLGASLLNS